MHSSEPPVDMNILSDLTCAIEFERQMILDKFGLQTASYVKWISDDAVLGGTVFENTTLHHIDRNISSQCRP